MSFEKYLENELNKPVNDNYYDPDGNSARAVVVRGFWGEVWWQYKAYPDRVSCELHRFKGFDTTIGWFVNFPVMFLLAPIIPVLAGRYSYRESIAEYRLIYERSKRGGSG